MKTVAARGALVRWVLGAAISAPIVVAAVPSLAQIAFQEVTAQVGIDEVGSTYGASWGDYDRDGLIDLWVGNHARPPSLYRNNGDGTFTDVASQVWPGPNLDTHGASWADVDSDGDLDLVETVGQTAAQHLWINQGSTFVDRASVYGFQFSGARGRDAVWYDTDSDGDLDLVFATASGSNPTPRLMARQGPVFVDQSATAGFTVAGAEYLQIGDLSGDGKPEIVVPSGTAFPAAVYAMPWSATLPLQDLRASLAIPAQGPGTTLDSVLADLTGDGLTDIVLAKQTADSELVPVSPAELKARVNGITAERGFTFRAASPVELSVQVTGTFAALRPEEAIRIGAGSVTPTSYTITLDPSDPTFSGTPPHTFADRGVWIGYDAATQTWRMTVTGLVVHFVHNDSTASISDATPVGFLAVLVDPSPNFFVRTATGFQENRTAAGLGVGLPCSAVVEGDFDNDMDLDLYFACSHPVSNMPNRLFQNSGSGTFTEVPAGGGASGSLAGRSDSVAVADYDADGFLDLFLVNGYGDTPFHNGPHQLFRNVGNVNHWVEVDLKAQVQNPTGIGAVVRVTTSSGVQTRLQNGGKHRHSQNSERVHFGLGPHATIDRLQVTWPDGRVSTLRNILADQVVYLEQYPRSSCGLGPELVLVSVGLLWMRGRTRRVAIP